MAAMIEPPMDLGSWIGRRTAAGPDRPAITFDGHTTNNRDFLDQIDQIDRLAAELVAGGVERGDRVGYLGVNDPMFLITLFAAARVGAIFVPMNFRLTASELAYIIGDAGVHTLIADAERAAIAEAVRAETDLRRTISLTLMPGWELLADLLGAREPLAAPCRPGPEDVAVIMYTSGTTGPPLRARCSPTAICSGTTSTHYCPSTSARTTFRWCARPCSTSAASTSPRC